MADRCCRDHNRGRSAPERSARIDRSAQLHRPLRLRHTDVDERRHGWNTAPAFVPSTGVGQGADANFHVRIGAVPVFNEDRGLAHLLRLSV
jgi:hypothetical protein